MVEDAVAGGDSAAKVKPSPRRGPNKRKAADAEDNATAGANIAASESVANGKTNTKTKRVKKNQKSEAVVKEESEDGNGRCPESFLKHLLVCCRLWNLTEALKRCEKLYADASALGPDAAESSVMDVKAKKTANVGKALAKESSSKALKTEVDDAEGHTVESESGEVAV